VKQFASVDDTVEVGGDLYSLDSDASATVEAGSPPPQVETTAATPATAAAPAAPPAPTPTSSDDHGRVPSIKFLGKTGWEARRSGISMTIPGLTAAALDVDLNYDPMFGRPGISEDEMEALESGGASNCPEVKKISHGAEFV